ncbi:nucleotidyl transferase AbiEii/AbiGii toxin family protein [Gilvimarinus agarilyticus]|uniref:nucleotidyl transferase AbiEii/AbiGii toxin family protein n=1 Tax=Gilvimarinus agarilyticus TaxID=679259 RepID=UPI0005A2AF28|nr:nucleotidyl transferase AbiEii/AbiGii toxin family protein [Gilvimarinus agarilyticus]
MKEHDIGAWVAEAESESNQEFREAVHTILAAIASEPKLRASMVLKGGILLAIRYNSHRFTKDIDLSTAQTLGQGFSKDEVVKSLNDSLAVMVETLDYDLDCIVQGAKVQPKGENVTFPSIKIKVGYAYKGSNKHKKLVANQSPTAISIDYSLNEATPNIDTLRLVQGDELNVYSLTDLIAEKYRSLLQQIKRNRNRRQDIFDLYLVLTTLADIDRIEKAKIKASLIEKSRARGIEPTLDSMNNPEIKTRAGRDYETLTDEVEGDLPDFEESFKSVLEFYRSLPW